MLEVNQCHVITGAPAIDPTLVVTPDADRRTGAYSEDTLIRATCTVKDARPVASISWAIGELLLHPLRYK
jgi:hypothetical protein